MATVPTTDADPLDDGVAGEAVEPGGLRISFPPELPVSARRDDIADAIANHQVVIVAGETGSGKTTQIPKICLALGRGRDGRSIGHTQPRRIAARSVAERIAEELATPLGDVVGYTIRFTDRSSAATRVKVMTDGILLAELQRDRLLRRYDTLIIDEAHERSLNIDFILGYLKQLLPKRPDLKVVITSATIDPERFSRHFDDAPVIEVSGRVYPVETRYREILDDQPTAIVDAVRELIREGPGDILVFLSGEREIRDAADALDKLQPTRVMDRIEVLPLFARLSGKDQHRVFEAHTTRRVVLATNVAETSLTVPGIRYVVDTGLARISRYSSRTKVQRLPIEPISRASADQRKGRCGRVADGICIRLYAEDDFEARARFTEPEILRTNLAAVILQMMALGLGDIARFPFVEAPDTRAVQAGLQLLDEIGATEVHRGRPRLTEVGRRLARLPVDPRLGRMLIEADRLGSLREVIVVTAALSMQDPRERPSDEQEKADQSHRRFADATSDFAGMLSLWRYLREQQEELSSSAFRRLCRREYLNSLRVREWQDLDQQLRQVAKDIGLTLNKQPAAAPAIHQALLAGLLSHIGLRDDERRDYLGARGTRFAVFPGSALFKKPPEYVMSAELVETARLWGRVNAAIDPAWAEEIGARLVKRSYSEPHWSQSRGAVMAREKVTLYGVPLAVDRLVNYGRIDVATSRDLFIRHALVQGEWRTHHAFFARNQALLEEVDALESRSRRRDIRVDEETLVDFYDARVPADVVSTAHFDAWWKRERRVRPELLTFTLDDLVHEWADPVTSESFPTEWEHGAGSLALDYRFEPGAPDDGVTVDLPVAALPSASADDFSWPVPGLRHDYVVALLRSLPKAVRVHVVPAPNVAKDFLAAVTPGQEPLLDALERYLLRVRGVVAQRADWDLDRVPDHLRLSFRVRDDAGDVLARGKDLDELRDALRDQTTASLAAGGSELERTGMTTWELDRLPREIELARAGHRVLAYPSLVDEGTTVGVRVLAAPSAQQAHMRAGFRRLGALAVGSPAAAALAGLDNAEKLSLGLAPHATIQELLDDCWLATVGSLVDDAGGPAWDREGFDATMAVVEAGKQARFGQILAQVRAAITAGHEVGRQLSGRAELSMLPALTDLANQRGRLLHPGFVAESGPTALASFPRYLAAMTVRLERLRVDPYRDAVLMSQVAPLQDRFEHMIEALPAGEPAGAGLTAVRWLLEELRVSLWAQQLGTAQPVSAKRVERALAEA